MKKPVVGQKLYSLNVGNASRRTVQKLTPVIVKKVGRKYFTCSPEGFDYRTQYHLDDWSEKSDYSAVSRLYESKQAWEDEKEAAMICKRLHCYFDYGRNRKNLSLETVKKVLEIIEGRDKEAKNDK